MAEVREQQDDDVEPPPYGMSLLSAPYGAPIPFGTPPPEPVTIDGEVPWELREEVPIPKAKKPSGGQRR